MQNTPKKLFVYGYNHKRFINQMVYVLNRMEKMRKELTTIGIFFFGLIVIRSILRAVYDIKEEWIIGIFIVSALILIYLVFLLFNSSRLKYDSVIPLGMYPRNPLDQSNKEMKRICIECGREITDEANICPKCGHRFP